MRVQPLLPTARLHIIAGLPGRYRPQERFPRRADTAGVVVRPLSDYEVAACEDTGVRLVPGHARPTSAEIVRGVRLLAGGV